jgi:deoxyribonuclease-4
VFDDFGSIIGFDRLKTLHLNDSKKPLGSRVDRHEHIGKGCIGIEPFRQILQDNRLKELPMILETPKTSARSSSVIEADPMDLENLNLLRTLRKK